jgi:hypothetical protein
MRQDGAGKPERHLARGVTRPVIDHDDLMAIVQYVKQLREDGSEPVFLVESRDYHADIGLTQRNGLSFGSRLLPVVVC